MTIAAELREAFVEGFDAEREVLGPEGDLDVIKHNTVKGYRAVETITTGWKARRTTQHATGEEFFEVSLVETDANLVTLFRGKPSHLGIGEYCYKIAGVEEPKTAIDVWIIRCSPTGERLDVGSFLITQSDLQLVTQANGLLRAH